MTNLINTVFINGQRTTFMNYVNPVVSAEVVTGTNSYFDQLFTAQWGSDITKWKSYNFFSDRVDIRFPVSFETLTGNISNGGADLGTNSRVYLTYSNFDCRLNTTNSTTRSQSNSFYYGIGGLGSYTFAVLNDYSLTFCGFIDQTRNTFGALFSCGWLKNAQYTSSQYPRNFYALQSRSSSSDMQMIRNETENSLTLRNGIIQNPTISCQVATPGANATDVLFRDNVSPNNYIGKLWNMIVLPSTAVVGKIYKNTGVDPDTGNIETDQKRFWLCVGTWGTDKIGMRVWTEGIA